MLQPYYASEAFVWKAPLRRLFLFCFIYIV
jgi:hypothetical protein